MIKATGVDGTVLIAWEHKNISPLAKLLMPETAAVPEWPEDRFDMVWVFDRPWHLTQVAQLLLAGDRAERFI